MNPENVFLFDFEDQSIHDNHNQKSTIFCSTFLGVKNPLNRDWPLLTRREISTIFFDGKKERILTLGNFTLHVTNCQEIQLSWWRIFLPVIIILSASVIVMMLAWWFQNCLMSREQKRKAEEYKSGNSFGEFETDPTITVHGSNIYNRRTNGNNNFINGRYSPDPVSGGAPLRLNMHKQSQVSGKLSMGSDLTSPLPSPPAGMSEQEMMEYYETQSEHNRHSQVKKKILVV